MIQLHELTTMHSRSNLMQYYFVKTGDEEDDIKQRRNLPNVNHRIYYFIEQIF